MEVEDGQLQRIETIVDQARALSTDQRARFLGEVCDGDATLRDEVETRLARDNPELSADLMESIALEAVAAASISIISRDDARSSPVAISTGEGRPSFVMEAVDGQPIDQYCDSHRLDVPARLKLFSRVCEAVHFAHQHAMIHRDLKPNHILVTADGMPTIAGFGIAKRIDSETHGERILTPEYASPEQIQGEPVTTAGDIYAMGVVLYQLLAGQWPYRLKTRSDDDVLQAACEQAPERPSIAVFRVDTQDDSAKIAAARSTTPNRLKRILAGDLDAIVLMALSKEPEGRYASAQQFADDLVRYRKGLPVWARRNSSVDRAVKFARRYAATIIAGLLLVLALIGGIVATTMSLVHARRERDRVEAAFRKSRQTVNPLFDRASENRLLSQAGLHPLRQALLLDLKRFYEDFLNFNQAGDDPSLRAELAEAHARLAKIHSLTGSATQAIAQYERAIALWETLVKAHPSDREYPANLAQTLNDFGAVLLPLNGRLDEALTAFSRAGSLIEPLLAEDPESVSLRHKLVAILTNIAQIQQRQGLFDEAAQSLEKVVEIESQRAAEDPQSLDPRIALASAYSALGRVFVEQPELVKAMTAYNQAIEILDSLTKEHPELSDQAEQLAADLGDLEQPPATDRTERPRPGEPSPFAGDLRTAQSVVSRRYHLPRGSRHDLQHAE